MNYKKYKNNKMLESYMIEDPFKIMYSQYGEKYLNYREKWKQAGENKNIFPFPLHLDIDLIRNCNSKCYYCSENIEGWNNDRMNLSLLTKILDECSTNGLYSLNVGFNAEPLYNKTLFFDALDLINRYKFMDFFIHTNAIALTSDVSEKILESSIKHICISLDAYKSETYKKLKNINFEIPYTNIMNFINMKEKSKSKFPIIRLSFVVNEDNYNEKNEFLVYWKKYANYIEFQTIGSFEIKNKNKFNKIIGTCNDPWKRISVYPNGDVFPCCSFTNNLKYLKLGNVYNDSIKSLWNGDKINILRSNLLEENKSNLFPGCRICLENRYELNNIE